MQRVAVQQVNRACLLALAGPPVAAGPVRLGVFADDVQNILRELHWLFCYTISSNRLNHSIFSAIKKLKIDEILGIFIIV